jgi:hypothetical protein
MLKAYLDLSQSHPQWVTSVAGYVATTDEWDTIIHQWQNCLSKWELGEFHYTELKWRKRAQWQECLNDFYQIL